jgi:hypothetical protein
MFVGWIGAARVTYKGDPNDETAEDEGKGWSRVIPRSLAVFSVIDVVSALVAFSYRNNICDVPLRRWLWGGILLGAPTDALIKGIFWILKPRYKYYKLKVVNCRGLAGSEFDLDRMEFFDEFGRPVEPIDQIKTGDCYMIQFKFPTMISSYRFLTSQSEDTAKDPVTWELHASNRKESLIWTVIDEVDEHDTNNIPLRRGQASPEYSDLQSISDNAAFRQAFLAEIFANAASFAWLVAGSAWIAGGSETCVDSAPELWYYCFLLAVLTWSCLGTVTMGLIISAVAMILVGNKA